MNTSVEENALTTNIEFVRDHEGKFDMRVSGVPAHGARVMSMSNVDGELIAVVYVPLRDATVAERDNVLRLRR